MRIVHITTIDEGGAYKAAKRIKESLIEAGLDSEILFRNITKESTSGTAFLESIPKTIISKAKNLANLIISRDRTIVREYFGSDISCHALVQEADVIILHWVNSFLSPKSLIKLLNLNKPIIWILHDMWPFTGGCHYDFYCGKFQEGCKRCPFLSTKREKDIAYRNFKDKIEVYKKYHFWVVGPSCWSVDMAQKSYMMRDKSIRYIPNCINTKMFYPRNTEKTRKRLGLPNDKKIVLFGADNAGTENKVKGFSYLLDAINYLKDDNVILLIFGRAASHTLQSIELEYKVVGYVESEDEMAEIYSVADVMVTPSIQEAFGFTVCEAMACGTAVAAFGVGGIVDQIEHKKSGYLAALYDSIDLAEGIRYCIRNSEILGVRAVQRAQRFSYANVGKQYQELIEEITRHRDKIMK